MLCQTIFAYTNLFTENLPFPENYSEFLGERASDLRFSLRRVCGEDFTLPAGAERFTQNGICVERFDGGFRISSGAGARGGTRARGTENLCPTVERGACGADVTVTRSGGVTPTAPSAGGARAYVIARERYTLLEAYAPDGAGEAFANCLRVALEAGLIWRDRMSMHAAAVELDGGAVLLTGGSGIGKSTRADILIERFGFTRISGDRPCVDAGTSPMRVYGMPWDGKEQCCRPSDNELKCIIEVCRGKGDFLKRLSPVQARRVMLARGFMPVWDEQTAARALNIAERIARNVPFYRLYCSPDEAGVSAIVKGIYQGDTRYIREAETDMNIKSGFALHKIMDEYMALPVGDNADKFEGTIVLNEVSAYIWNQMQAPITLSDLVARVTGEFDIDAATAEADIRALIAKFRDMKVLEE